MLKMNLPIICEVFENGFEVKAGNKLGMVLEGHRNSVKIKIMNFSRSMILLGMLFSRIGMGMRNSLFMHDCVNNRMGIWGNVK